VTKFETESLEKQLLKMEELAKQTGVAVGTLRYYESLGLLEPALRSSSGYRYYTADAARQVQFIKKAQRLNFSLQEIQQILVSRRQ
jgi:DNA-binding transcriptional MerR regulator